MLLPRHVLDIVLSRDIELIPGRNTRGAIAEESPEILKIIQDVQFGQASQLAVVNSINLKL